MRVSFCEANDLHNNRHSRTSEMWLVLLLEYTGYDLNFKMAMETNPHDHRSSNCSS
jgi:hypothetical protein